MANYPDPAFDLAEVQRIAKAGFAVHIGMKARDGVARAGLAPEDIIPCLLQLTAADFSKSMDATNQLWKGCRQDVYKPTYNGVQLYVKFQFWPADSKRLYVASFKEKKGK